MKHRKRATTVRLTRAAYAEIEKVRRDLDRDRSEDGGATFADALRAIIGKGLAAYRGQTCAGKS